MFINRICVLMDNGYIATLESLWDFFAYISPELHSTTDFRVCAVEHTVNEIVNHATLLLNDL